MNIGQNYDSVLLLACDHKRVVRTKADQLSFRRAATSQARPEIVMS